MSSRSGSRPYRVTPRVSLTIHGPLTRSRLPALTERCCAVFATHAGHLVDCDVTGVVADAVTVDALARLQRIAHTNGCRVVLRNASEELLQLVELMGLTDVLGQASRRDGRPNSGNSRAVSRKNVISPIAPSVTSTTCRAHGAYPPSALGLY